MLIHLGGLAGNTHPWWANHYGMESENTHVLLFRCILKNLRWYTITQSPSLQSALSLIILIYMLLNSIQ